MSRETKFILVLIGLVACIAAFLLIACAGEGRCDAGSPGDAGIDPL